MDGLSSGYSFQNWHCHLRNTFHTPKPLRGVKSALLGVNPLPRHAELPPVELVRECAGSRDPEAWAEFIRRFQPVIAAAVVRTAYGNQPRQVLDDLIQDTYLKLCENDCRLLKSFEPRGKNSIFGYLKVVAANVVHDHFKSVQADKRGANQTESLPPEPMQIDPKTTGTDSAASIYQNLRLEEIDRILRRVTAGKDQERKCAIFWLRHRQGFTASEIAALPWVGLSTEGVESLLLRLSIVIKSHINKHIGS